jgi:hypothetical protein
LSDRQWADAFRAGGYTEQSAAPFLRKIKANIAMGQQVGRAATAFARPATAPPPPVTR